MQNSHYFSRDFRGFCFVYSFSLFIVGFFFWGGGDLRCIAIIQLFVQKTTTSSVSDKYSLLCNIVMSGKYKDIQIEAYLFSSNTLFST